jgi:hypothetical protein
MRAITIIKRSERRPASIQSGALLKQPKLTSVSNERALIKTVESWIIERRESARIAVGKLPITALFSNHAEPQDEAESIAAAVLSERASLLQSTLGVMRSS